MTLFVPVCKFLESEGSRDENDEDITTARDVRLSMDDIESSGTTTEAAAEVEPSVRRRTQPARSSEEDGISARTRLKLNILDVPWEKPDENTAKKYMVNNSTNYLSFFFTSGIIRHLSVCLIFNYER